LLSAGLEYLVIILWAILEIIVLELTVALGSLRILVTNLLATFFAVSMFLEFLTIFLETLSLIFSMFLGSAFFLFLTIFFSNFLATLSAISLLMCLGTLMDLLFSSDLASAFFSIFAETFSAILETTKNKILKI